MGQSKSSLPSFAGTCFMILLFVTVSRHHTALVPATDSSVLIFISTAARLFECNNIMDYSASGQRLSKHD